MSDVFISYSRKDKEFVKTLHVALSANSCETWVDWQDIPLTADWWQEIERGIEAADTFVFVLSADAIASKVCKQEIDHAVKHNKRLIPIVRRNDFAAELVHPVLQKHNWLFFQEQDEFEVAFQQLLEVIATDLDHVRTHTRLLVRAIEWDNKQRNDSFLLRGTDLAEAERWLDAAINPAKLKEPQPTEQQKTYIHKSREVEEANRRLVESGRKARRMVRVGSIVLASTLLLAAIVGTIAGRRLQQANLQLKVAELEQAGLDATNQFESQEIEALLLAMRSGQELQALIQSNLSSAEYPTYKPISTLQQILNTIQEKNQVQESSEYPVLQSQRFEDVVWSPDGTQFATTSDNGTAHLWDLQGNQLAELNGHQHRVKSISFSPDGKLLATASHDGTARLWDLQGNQHAEFKHSTELHDASFSPDGKLLATASHDGTAHLWDLQGDLRAEFKGHQSAIFSVSFSPNGQSLATASNDGTLRLWDLQGNQQLSIQHGVDELRDASFSPDGKYLATASNTHNDGGGTARLWDLQGNQLAEFKGHRGGVFSVGFSPDGRSLLTTSSDSTARLWDLQGNQQSMFRGHHGLVTKASFSPDGQQIITASVDGTARLWNLHNHLATFQGHQNGLLGATFSPNGTHIATASDDGTARLWNLQGNSQAELKGHQSWVRRAILSPDGKTVATAGADAVVRLWDLQGNLKHEFATSLGSIYDMSFSPDGQSLITAQNTAATLWDLQGNSKTTFTNGVGISSVAFNPDGDSLATVGANGIIRLWQTEGQLLTEFKTHFTGRINSVEFAPDGELLVTASDDGMVQLWDLQGNLHSEFRARHHSVKSIAFSPDGKYLATAANDRTAQLWDLHGNQLAEFNGHQDWVRDVNFSPDGKYLLTASADGTARLWRVETLDQLLARGCTWLEDYFVSHPADLAELEVCHTEFRLEQAVPALIREGEAAAKSGDMTEAIATFRQALEWQPSLELNPKTKAQQFRLIGEGETLAESGDVEEAVAKFQAALDLDTGLDFDPDAKAKRIAVPALVRQGEQFITDGKFEEAIATFTDAQMLDPNLNISFNTWNSLCWKGSLNGYAATVLDACEQAVELVPTHGGVRDSRGLARALTGDTVGAIADFQAFIDWDALDNFGAYKTKRQQWIDALRAGQNPFTPEELERLRSEG